MTHVAEHNEEEKKSLNFIEMAVEADLAAGKNGGRLNTRSILLWKIFTGWALTGEIVFIMHRIISRSCMIWHCV